MVKTFTIWAVPGNVKFSDKISNAVGKTSGSSSSISGSVTSTEAENESSQKHSTEFDFNIWKEVESGVKSMLSPSGKVSITQASGTVTVSDNVAVLRNVGKFIDELNSRLARQVALSIKVYSVEVNDSLEAGLDLSLLFETGDAVVSAGAMPLGLLGLGGEISATVVDGKLKDSGAMLKALRSIGQATQVTSGGAIVMSNQSVPIHALQRVAYLASSSISTTDYGQTTDLTPGEITTGFSMSVVPHVLGGRRLILYYSINLSSLEGITNFESGGSRVQLPQVASRAFSQRMNLKLGQTVVLAGFEQVVDSDGNNAGLMGFGKSRGYKKSLMIITIATESGVQNG
jgi:type IVB pilus formation R64 PilN family outer membrane protein